MQNSVYGLFPFFTPEVTKTNLQKLGLDKSYEFVRPVAKPVEKIVDTVKDIEAILSDKANYQVPECPLFGPKTASNFSLVPNLCVVFHCGWLQCRTDDALWHSSEQRKTALLQALFPTPDAYTKHRAWFGTQVQQLIKDHTFQVSGLPGSRLDVVGNVINQAPAYWVANYIVRSAASCIAFSGNGTDCAIEIGSLVSRSRMCTRKTVSSPRRRSMTCSASSSPLRT